MFGTIFRRIWRPVLECGLRRPFGLTRPHPTVEQLRDRRIVAGTDATVLHVEDQRSERLIDGLLPGLRVRSDDRARHAPFAPRVRIDAGIDLDLPAVGTALACRALHRRAR